MKTTNYIVKRGPLAALFIMFIVFYACSDDDQPQNQKAEVTDFSPVTGGRNTLLTLNGTNFGTDPNHVKVTINGKEAVVKTVTNEVITAEVQKGTSSGTVRVILGERPNAQILIYDQNFTYVSNQVVSTYLKAVARQTELFLWLPCPNPAIWCGEKTKHCILLKTEQVWQMIWHVSGWQGTTN